MYLALPPRKLKEFRERLGKTNKDDDADVLIELYLADSRTFYNVERRDRAMIRAREANRALTTAMKVRIACEQRIRASLVGDIFCSEEGGYSEGEIEQLYDEAKANDVVLNNLLSEERKRENRLVLELAQVPIYCQLFEPIEGVGPKIAARILVNIGDIRLFQVDPDLESLTALKAEIDEIERTVYDPIRSKLAGEFARHASEWQGKTGGELHWLQLGAAAAWLRTTGRSQEAIALQRAIELHQERSKVRRRAHTKGRSKLKAFSGVHLINGPVQCQHCWAVWDPNKMTGDAGADSDFSEESFEPSVTTVEHSGTVCAKCGSTEIVPHGTFPRRRRDNTCNWTPEVRQAMYLLGDQFNRRPNTRWGQLQRAYKAKLRVKYPEAITVDGKKRYSDAHIHRMATWKALSKFVEWLFDEWTDLEAGKTASLKQGA